MFRSICALVLVVAFAIQSFNRAFIVLDYYANTASFARNCENKLRPQMHCNGKCIMMAKLKDAEKKDQRAPERKLQNKYDVTSSRSFFATLPLLNFRILNSSTSSFYFPVETSGYSKSIFHPPSQA